MFTETASRAPPARHTAHCASACSSTSRVSGPIRPGLLGKREEFERRDHAEPRMRPAQQRLDGDRLAVAQIELGLVVEHQLLVLDGGAQLVDEHEAVPAVVDVGLVDLERSLPELGAVHRDVGAPHEPDAVGGVGRGHGDADAAR